MRTIDDLLANNARFVEDFPKLREEGITADTFDREAMTR